MDIDRFKLLLTGQVPTIEDFAFFVELSEGAEPKVLWSLLINNTKMSLILKNIINKSLHDKLPRQKNTEAVKEIIEKLKTT